MNEVEVVLDWLRQEFAGAHVELRDEQTLDTVGFHVQAAGTRYQLRIPRSFLAARDAEQIRQAFKDFSVAEVMRQLGDFRVTLTEYGCMF